MKKCFECGKELKILNSYRHPVLGTKEFVCWTCCKRLKKFMDEYGEFISDCFKREENNMAFKNINLRSKFSNFWNNIKILH